MTPTSPTSFIFHFPEGEKRSEDMTREELLQVIEYLRQEQQARRAEHARDLDILAGRPRR